AECALLRGGELLLAQGALLAKLGELPNLVSDGADGAALNHHRHRRRCPAEVWMGAKPSLDFLGRLPQLGDTRRTQQRAVAEYMQLFLAKHSSLPDREAGDVADLHPKCVRVGCGWDVSSRAILVFNDRPAVEPETVLLF